MLYTFAGTGCACRRVTTIGSPTASFEPYAGVLEPAYTWDHYIAVPDAEDREWRSFGNKARRVLG